MTTVFSARPALLICALAAATMLPAQDAVAAKYSFQSQQTGKCMVGALDGRVITDTCYSTRTNQQWEWVDSGSHVKLRNVATGMCLQARSTAMSSASCAGISSQNFFLYGPAQNYWQIVNVGLAKCYASLSGTTVPAYVYPNPCIQDSLKYSWKGILR